MFVFATRLGATVALVSPVSCVTCMCAWDGRVVCSWSDCVGVVCSSSDFVGSFPLVRMVDQEDAALSNLVHRALANQDRTIAVLRAARMASSDCLAASAASFASVHVDSFVSSETMLGGGSQFSRAAPPAEASAAGVASTSEDENRKKRARVLAPGKAGASHFANPSMRKIGAGGMKIVPQSMPPD